LKSARILCILGPVSGALPIFRKEFSYGEHKRRRFGIATVTLLMIGAGGGHALAQSADPHFFAESRDIVGDWTFVPIYHIDAQQTAVVNGLFVYADESTRTGNNLSAVWY